MQSINLAQEIKKQEVYKQLTTEGWGMKTKRITGEDWGKIRFYKPKYLDEILFSKFPDCYCAELDRLTPGGFEFADDPKSYLAYIKERLDSGMQAKKDLVLFKKSLPGEQELENIITSNKLTTQNKVETIYKRLNP